MDAKLVSFGEIEIDGRRFTHDVVVEGELVRKRRKGPSNLYRERYVHTSCRDIDNRRALSSSSYTSSITVIVRMRRLPSTIRLSRPLNRFVVHTIV